MSKKCHNRISPRQVQLTPTLCSPFRSPAWLIANPSFLSLLTLHTLLLSGHRTRAASSSSSCSCISFHHFSCTRISFSTARYALAERRVFDPRNTRVYIWWLGRDVIEYSYPKRVFTTPHIIHRTFKNHHHSLTRISNPPSSLSFVPYRLDYCIAGVSRNIPTSLSINCYMSLDTRHQSIHYLVIRCCLP
jgi:hypothetical protein